jgi:hypothetical protein
MTSYTCTSCESTESFADDDVARRAGRRGVIIESPIVPDVHDMTPGVIYEVSIEPVGAGDVCPACQAGGAIYAERLAEQLALPLRAGGWEYDGPGRRTYSVVPDVLFPASVSPDDLWTQIRELAREHHETCGDGYQFTETPEITSMRIAVFVKSDLQAPALRATLTALPSLIADVSYSEVLDPAEA